MRIAYFFLSLGRRTLIPMDRRRMDKRPRCHRLTRPPTRIGPIVTSHEWLSWLQRVEFGEEDVDFYGKTTGASWSRAGPLGNPIVRLPDQHFGNSGCRRSIQRKSLEAPIAMLDWRRFLKSSSLESDSTRIHSSRNSQHSCPSDFR